MPARARSCNEVVIPSCNPSHCTNHIPPSLLAAACDSVFVCGRCTQRATSPVVTDLPSTLPSPLPLPCQLACLFPPPPLLRPTPTPPCSARRGSPFPPPNTNSSACLLVLPVTHPLMQCRGWGIPLPSAAAAAALPYGLLTCSPQHPVAALPCREFQAPPREPPPPIQQKPFNLRTDQRGKQHQSRLQVHWIVLCMRACSCLLHTLPGASRAGCTRACLEVACALIVTRPPCGARTCAWHACIAVPVAHASSAYRA